MPEQLKNALTMGVHALVVLIVVTFANAGIKIPDSTAGAVQDALIGLAIAAWAFIAHWLATRPGVSTLAKVAHLVANLMTLGLGALIPADVVVDRRARNLYAAYGKSTGGVNYQGLPMPRYEDLGGKVQDAWRAVARR